MYLFRKEKVEEITKRFKIKQLAKEIGIHEVQLSRIIHNKSKTSKPVAYIFTKLVDKEAEINDYFIRKEK